MSNHPSVLIVDDDAMLLDMYSVKFRERGFEVAVAAGGEEALGKVEGGEKPDVILIDIVMPGMDGFTLLEKLAAARRDGKPHLVVLSNQGQESEITRAKEIGADEYLVKANTIPSEVVDRVSVIAGGATPQEVNA